MTRVSCINKYLVIIAFLFVRFMTRRYILDTGKFQFWLDVVVDFFRMEVVGHCSGF